MVRQAAGARSACWLAGEGDLQYVGDPVLAEERHAFIVVAVKMRRLQAGFRKLVHRLMVDVVLINLIQPMELDNGLLEVRQDIRGCLGEDRPLGTLDVHLHQKLAGVLALSGVDVVLHDVVKRDVIILGCLLLPAEALVVEGDAALATLARSRALVVRAIVLVQLSPPFLDDVHAEAVEAIHAEGEHSRHRVEAVCAQKVATVVGLAEALRPVARRAECEGGQHLPRVVADARGLGREQQAVGEREGGSHLF
mmetsp:Transcript_125143/g.325117  ORF Transcript_125143/g.325117 Transcript_125143/m.325117 type:complete len:252 (+) Transcript_125143:172-927(+)